MQEIDGHISYINTICFEEEGNKMFSGDGLGQLHVWNVFVTDQPSKRGKLHLVWTQDCCIVSILLLVIFNMYI